jgi:hypothetical protein
MVVVIVGAGWAGAAAAIAARKRGAEVILVERTDMILGCGLVGGIMRNNGRSTATEEMIAMSGGELFQVTDEMSLHRDIAFPGHDHASLYNAGSIEPAVKDLLIERGIEIRLTTRIDDVEQSNGHLTAVLGKKMDEPVRIEGDVFVDATGTAGPPGQCGKYGNGCAMCVLRCPSFGGRVSITAKCGITEMIGRKGGQVGAMSGSCELYIDSLGTEIVEELEETGVAVVPVPSGLQSEGKLKIKACQQYALPAYSENLVLLHTGQAKLMSPFFPLDLLRKIPEFEHARFKDPYAGGLGNSVRFVGMAPRDDALRVKGVDNLFCAGEKAGLLVGHTEAIVTGTLAGHNAARAAAGQKSLVLPPVLAVGDAISFVREQMATGEGLGYKYTFSGSIYYERMVQKGLYQTEIEKINRGVDEAGLSGIFA